MQTARGSLTVNGVGLKQGDGAAISDESGLDLRTREGAEVLVSQLA